MKSNFVIALLLSTSSSTILKQQNSNFLQLEYDYNSGAAELNAYKLYNMSQVEKQADAAAKEEQKNPHKKADANDDLAEEMDEDNTEVPVMKAEPKKKVEAPKLSAFEQLQSANPYGDQDTEALQENEAAQVQEDVQQSKQAAAASQGDHTLRVDLSSNEDSLYVGSLYLGTPSQPVKVIFDTGSEHLAVSSDLCSGCKSKAFTLAQSKTQQLLSQETKTVVYGSAKFEGKETQDRTCVGKDEQCINFKFLSLQKGEGLDAGADGILGLSPEMSTDRNDQHFVWSLMKQKLISKASFSLSMADEGSFAVFGGSDYSQVVGGEQGLKPFRNNPDIFSHIKAWALSGQGLFYGGPQIGTKGTYPAVIDTGSTVISVPGSLFQSLQAAWKEGVKDLDCTSDANFCQSLHKCDEIEKLLQPVGFLIAGGSQVGGETVFEINPSEYLNQDKDKCQFAIAENKLDKFNNKNFIFGQQFLKHFYTVFNYENEQLSLGINVHSEGKVRMYAPGMRGSAEASNEPSVVEV